MPTVVAGGAENVDTIQLEETPSPLHLNIEPDDNLIDYACQDLVYGHETWLKVLDTPSLLISQYLLGHLAHETMYTQACCAGCVTAHT